MEETLIQFETQTELISKGIVINSKYIRLTQSLLQKWLREKHDIHIEIPREALGSDEMEYKYILSYLPKEFKDAKRWVSHLKYIDSFSCYGSTYSGAWQTYELALEQALIESLRLIP
jgi:hypothetical protein